MRTIQNRAGYQMPVLGQGTWKMGERPDRRRAEVEALQLGIDLGLTLIDTAEMYGDGEAERVVAEAITGRRRAQLFLVSKVLPTNASRAGTLRACEHSLGRLRTDYIDLYLLHWPGSHPLEETYRAFVELQQQEKIRHYGVSNFDLAQMQQSESAPGGDRVGVNQVVYNLQRRGIERRLLPWCREHQVTVMAYSPLEQARLRQSDALRNIAKRRGLTPYQVALAWTLREPGVVAIPKAGDARHVRKNATAASLRLSEEELAEIDGDHPVPAYDVPLGVL